METQGLLCLPSLERIKEVLLDDSIKASGNVVPIFRTVSSQILPLSHSAEEAVMQVFLRLRRGPYSFLLEGVTEAVHRQRYVVMGSEPYKVIETGRRKEGVIEEDKDPLMVLEAEMKKWKMVDLPELKVNHNWLGGENEEAYADYRAIPLGSCGAIGYVAYDAVRHFEPRVDNRNKADPLGLPESVWMFYNCLVAYDFHKHCCHIVSLCRVDGDLEANYKQAVSRLEELQARLLTVRGGEEEPLDDYTNKDAGISNAGEEGYKKMVTALKKNIIEGDIIQAVPSHRLSRATPVHPFKIYQELRKLNPSPYMYYFDMQEFQIVGASPECLIRVDDGVVSTHPIAGTSRRGKNAEEDRLLETKLISDPKERAEHIMLVDLGRNDVNRVCDSHSTKVDRLMVCERYAHVMHIVSKVTGRLRPDKTAFDAFRSVFPAGTVSGAPKVKAMELINGLEKEIRSVYAGCVGYLSFSGTMDTCIAIRTLVYKNGVAYIQAGGGIVLDSDEQYEYNETVYKMRSQLSAVEKAEKEQEASTKIPNASYSVNPSKRDQPLMKFQNWDTSSFSFPEGYKWGGSDPSAASDLPTPLGGKVLLIDNYDSFTWNLYQYLSMLGSCVVVYRNDQITVEQAVALNPDRIVISPGPGYPDTTGVCRDIIKEFAGKVPILGVCLGHQTIVDVFGGKIVKSPEILHGKTSAIRHDGFGIYFGLPSDVTVDVSRYHSLVADPTTLPKCLEVTSKTLNGIIMGVRHVELQIEGVQFHPESILTEKGMLMLNNFLLHQGGKRPTSVKQCVQKLQQSGQITSADLRDVLISILRGGVNEAQISALLGLLPVEKISPSLLNACAETVVSFTKQIPNFKSPNNYIDIVGTGGDGKETFNASSAAAIVIAACGGKVMKHGNRSSSGSVGSADLLEALGVKLDLNEEQIATLSESSNFTFLFSQSFHPNMKSLNAARKQLGLRTIFNLLGPITNPSRPNYQVIGTPTEQLGKVFAEALAERKYGRYFVVSSFDGVDEVSIASPTHLWTVENGEVKYQVIKPEDFGIKAYESIDVVCNLVVHERIERFKKILEGEEGPFTDFVLVNAAVGLYCMKLADDLKSALIIAREALKSGKAKEVMNNYVKITQRLSGTKTILNTIVQQRKLDVAAAKVKSSLDHLKSLLPHAPPSINFIARIKQAGIPAIFAEVKRASPSKGDIAPRIDAAEVGLIFGRAGAAVVSVLTEPKWFKGSLNDMRAVRTAVDRLGHHCRPAVLCKDFILEEYQIYQARIYGADALLLIVAAIHDDAHLVKLINLTRELGMEPLVEVNNDNEMQRALQCNALVIGINNRNLHTFNVDLETTTRIAQSIEVPQDVTIVALSGISCRADVEKFEEIGVNAVLVGEALMKSPNPHRMLKELAGQVPPPFVKICGVKSVLAASTAALAGADMIGLIFAPRSSRRVEINTAKEIARVVRNLRSTTSSPSQLVSMLPMRVKANRNQTPEKWFGEWSSYLETAVHQYKPLIVGVFADQSPKEIELIAAEVGLDIIQLSGDEGFAAASNHPTRPVIKAVHVEAHDTADSVLSRILPGHGAAVLLDTRSGTQKGGTGTTFDWAVAKSLQNRGLPVVLAGGLNLDNISTAVHQVRPFMVDVATGVETAGQKDLEKIKSFIRLAKFSQGTIRPDCVIHRGLGTGVSPMPARFGDFGGRYVPETLIEALEELERTYWEAKHDPSFHAEVNQLLRHFVGRPTPVYFAKRLTEEAGGARIWFKREDLCHTGAHKINNSVAQAILAKRLGKKRIIAETGAGQHGVATATACALLGLECTVYMGSDDCKRQSLNVFRMNNLGTKVVAVESGSRTLKDAINEAMRDWVTNVRTTHYLVGSAIGPHPFPTLVRDFQSVIGNESKEQMLLFAGKLPDVVMACVGGGSNSIGMFHPYIQEPTMIVGVEAGGHGVASGKHSATLSAGTPGVLHGTRTYLLQDDMGQITETHSLSAGLDYPGVGPEHAWLKATGRGVYLSVTDDEAMIGFDKLSRVEGIVPALETSHAIFQAIKMAGQMRKDQDILVVLSGRGDKDFMTVANTLGVSLGDSVSVLGANLRKT